jgi:hypothetical protein
MFTVFNHLYNTHYSLLLYGTHYLLRLIFLKKNDTYDINKLQKAKILRGLSKHNAQIQRPKCITIQFV